MSELDKRTEYRYDVADAILRQLGDSRFICKPGAKQLTVTETPGLAFRLPTRNRVLPNYVRIVLDAHDEYSVQFAHIRGGKIKVLSMHEHVPVENLVALFEEQTQLYTSL